MELIERYLSNVRILLPMPRREAVIAELREAVMMLREELEAELGHAPSPEEDEGLLRDIGHPVLVAAHYCREQYLVGPELYPVYILTIRFVVAIIAGIGTAFGLVVCLASSGAGVGVVKALSIAGAGTFAAVGAITLVFAVLQYRLPHLGFLHNWRARDLPRRQCLEMHGLARMFRHGE
jgi:hypothetical protein